MPDLSAFCCFLKDEMCSADLAARFNEAVIVEKINTAATDTIEQELREV